MRDCTVIVPTWNMGRFLEPLLQSIVQSPMASELAEIIFVCEKSNDGSEQIIEKLVASRRGQAPLVRMIQPSERKGTFMTRYHGAKAATTEWLLFIDSRITIPASTAQVLPEIWRKFGFVMGKVEIDIEKNIFCLYWQRSHETIFKKTYDGHRGITTVQAKDFDKFLIGSTSFICPRRLFVEASDKYLDTPLLSDDTLLLGEMIQQHPITIHPDYRFQWEPRDRTLEFLRHLFKRGPGFAEYHLFEKRGVLFYAVGLGGVFTAVEFSLFFIWPGLAALLLGASLAALFLSTALLAKSFKEFIRLAPLHTAVILSYGFGALRGAWVVYKRRRQRSRDQSRLLPPRSQASA